MGSAIGHTLVDITQHDHEEWEENGFGFVMLHFDDGQYMKFYIERLGFDHNCEPAE